MKVQTLFELRKKGIPVLDIFRFLHHGEPHDDKTKSQCPTSTPLSMTLGFSVQIKALFDNQLTL